MEMAMGKKQYTKYETRRTARPRSERLKALGAAGTVATGSSLGGVSALRSALDAHIVNAAVHVTAAERKVWNLVASLFGVDSDGNVYVKDGRGLWSESFMSSRGSDPGADGGASGVDMDTVWAALAAGTSELINVSHIPELSISKITGLQDALDAKLEGITKGMVEAVLTGTVTSHNHDGRYAPLSGGLIPSQYLPSYVDDVVEYASMTAFPATGEAGKIYVALDTNLTYRWGGSGYVEISPSLALGHTSSTAYPGDEGAANASAIQTLQGYFSGGAAKRVEHALTLSFADGAPAVYDGSAAVEVTVPTEAQMTLWDRISALFDIDADGNVYVKDNRGFYGNSFVSSRGSDAEAGSSGSGLDEDAMWDALAASGSEVIDPSHIPALSRLPGALTNAQLVNDSISVAGVAVALGGSVSTAQIASALTAAGYKLTDNDTTYTLTKSGSTITLTGSNGSKTSVTDSNTTYTLGSFGITATAAEINRLDGITASTAELNFVDGVTSNIQTQLNAKANASALSAYALKDGSNASGTWPISISGNASSATKLATARTLWGKSFDGSGNVSGDMSGVGWINNGLRVSILGSSSDGSDTARLATYGHNVEFGGPGYSHKKYFLRPEYGSQGSTNASLYIQNASASGSPVFTTTHAFDPNGNATHSGALSAGSSITTGGHLFMKAASGRFVFNSAGSGFMMSMESGNFRLISHNTGSFVARLVEVDMSGNVGIKASPASGYALNVAGAGLFTGLLTASGGLTTPQYVQVGSGRLRWDAANNALYVEKSDGTACGLYSKGYMSARRERAVPGWTWTRYGMRWRPERPSR